MVWLELITQHCFHWRRAWGLMQQRLGHCIILALVKDQHRIWRVNAINTKTMGAARHNLARLQDTECLRRLIKVQLALLDQIGRFGGGGAQGRIKDKDFVAKEDCHYDVVVA